MERSLYLCSDRNHFWKWSTLIGGTVQTGVCRFIIFLNWLVALLQLSGFSQREPTETRDVGERNTKKEMTIPQNNS